MAARCAGSKSKEDNNQNLYRKEVTVMPVISGNFQVGFWSSSSLLHAKIGCKFDMTGRFFDTKKRDLPQKIEGSRISAGKI